MWLYQLYTATVGACSKEIEEYVNQRKLTRVIKRQPAQHESKKLQEKNKSQKYKKSR